jgi:outer membrane protein
MRILPVFVLVLTALGASLPARSARAQTDSSPAIATRQRVLTLAQVERVAMAQQPQVLVARAQTSIAEAQAEQAGAPLLPQVMGTAQYQRTTGNFVPRPGAIPAGVGGATPSGWTLNPKFDAFNFGLNATQLIYDFGQTTGKHRAAEATVDVQRSSEHVTSLQILAGVRRAYFSARAMKELVDVARETLEGQKKHLMQVQGFVQVGTQPAIALAQQKAAVANAQVLLITAQNNYETAKAQLNQAAGILESLVAAAFAARPEMATLLKQREAQEATLISAKGGYGPTLSAAANGTEGGTALDGLVPNWNVGLLLNWPIFQGGLTKGQVHQAEASLQSVDAQRALEQLQVQLDVNSAQLAVRAAKATIGAAEDALASAREQLRLAEQRYATGVGSIIELNDAQVGYTTAAAQAVQARYGLASARAQLLAALGRTT